MVIATYISDLFRTTQGNAHVIFLAQRIPMFKRLARTDGPRCQCWKTQANFYGHLHGKQFQNQIAYLARLLALPFAFFLAGGLEPLAASPLTSPSPPSGVFPRILFSAAEDLGAASALAFAFGAALALTIFKALHVCGLKMH